MNNEPSSYRNYSDQRYAQSPYESSFSPIFAHNSPYSSDPQSFSEPPNYLPISGEGWQKNTHVRGEVIAISLSVCVAVIMFLGGIIWFTQLHNRRVNGTVAMAPGHLLDNFDVCDAESVLEQAGLSMFTLSEHQPLSSVTRLKNEHGEFQVHNCEYVSGKEAIEIGKIDLGDKKIDLTRMKANVEDLRSKFVDDSKPPHIPNSLDIRNFTTTKNLQGLLWILYINKGPYACGVSTESALTLFLHTDAKIIDMLLTPADNSISVATCDKLENLAKNIT